MKSDAERQLKTNEAFHSISDLVIFVSRLIRLPHQKTIFTNFSERRLFIEKHYRAE